MKRGIWIMIAVAAGAAVMPSYDLLAQQRRTRDTRQPRGFSYGAQPAGGTQGTPMAPAYPPGSMPAATGQASAPQTPWIPAEMARPGKALPEDYAILGHRSIFEKERRPYRSPTQRWQDRPPVEPVAVAPKAPGIPVLVGVLLGDDSYIAYIEDPDSGKLWPFAPGDALPDGYGAVGEVTLNDIEIIKDGASRRLPIGKNLKGETPDTPLSTPSVAATTGGSGTQPAGVSVPGLDPANTADMTIEQKMKLRRQQQVGQ